MQLIGGSDLSCLMTTRIHVVVVVVWQLEEEEVGEDFLHL